MRYNFKKGKKYKQVSTTTRRRKKGRYKVETKARTISKAVRR